MYPTMPTPPAPPVSYPPAQPQYAPPAPGYAPMPTTQYAPPPAPAAPAYAPPAAPAPAVNAPAGFSAPVNTAVARPRIMDMAGRLVLIRPTKIERNVPNTIEPGKFQDRITADVIVLDGGPLDFGGKPEKGIAHTIRVDAPYVVQSMWITQQVIVLQLEREINGAVLGRIGRGQATGNRQPAWRLLDPSDADRAVATAYIHAERSGQLAPQQQVAAAPAAAPVAAQPAPAPFVPQQYAPAPMAAPVPLPPPPMAPAAPVEPANPGYDPAWWASLPIEHKQHYAQQAAAAAQQAGPQAGQPASWS